MEHLADIAHEICLIIGFAVGLAFGLIIGAITAYEIGRRHGGAG